MNMQNMVLARLWQVSLKPPDALDKYECLTGHYIFTSVNICLLNKRLK